MNYLIKSYIFKFILHIIKKNLKYKNLLKRSKKPIFIIGQGPLISDDSENLFYFLLDIYNKSSTISGWSGFNVLQNYSGRVGALDLKFYNKNNVNKKSSFSPPFISEIT